MHFASFDGKLCIMKHYLLFTYCFTLLIQALPAVAQSSNNATTATVLIASYNSNKQLMGWGSGFFVDEAVIVTNKHVVDNGNAAFYRIFATGSDGSLLKDCYRDVTKSDLRLNLQNDVAYFRAYILCDHGVMEFTDDPSISDPLELLGYPANGTENIAFTVTSGIVTGYTDNDWLRTSAHLDFGNSGGPVVTGNKVLGVAVAKGIDEAGNFVEGYFIPSSVIVNGLLYANDSQLGYTPGYVPKPSPRPATVSSSSSSVSSSTSSISSSAVSSSSKRSRLPRLPSASSVSIEPQQSSSISSQRFLDVLPTVAAYQAVQSLVERGIIQGYEDGTFRPQADINRAEFLKILVGGFAPEELVNETACFSDVQQEWFAQYVCAAKRLGWVNGYPNGSFKPAQQINRAEAIKIVMNAFGKATVTTNTQIPSDVRGSVWYYQFVQLGVQAGIISPTVRFKPAENLTRQDAAMWIYTAE